MRRQLVLLLVFISVIAIPFVFANGGGEEKGGGQVTLLQGKPEIDAQLKEIAKKFEAQSGIKVVVKSCGGDACAMFTQLRSDINAGEAPDIFTIDGIEAYKTFSDMIADLSDESWVANTDVAFKSPEGQVVGFPVAIEGWGLAHNVELLKKAGVDPASLTSYDAYKAAFEKIDGMKDALGIDSVVSMAAGPGMHWVTAHHNFNSYLSNGLARDDLSIVNQGLAGNVDERRLREYTKWVKLLFDYSDRQVLLTGNYDQQVGAFVNQKAVFVHQGNWIEPNLVAAGADFDRAFAPQGSTSGVTDGVFVSAPSWYVLNKDGNTEEAKAFLDFIASTPEGHDYLVNQIQAIPAFKNVTIKPTAPLSASLLDWSAQGKTYAWNQYHFPDDFRNQQLGPIYEQFAKGEITEEEFIDLFTNAIATLK